MIEFDTFYREYKQDMRDLNQKIDDNHKEVEPKLEDLCKRMTTIETEQEKKRKASEKKYKNIAIVISVISGISSIWTLVKAIH